MLISRPISRNGEGNVHRQVMKTPGRPLQGRGENAIRYAPGTVNGKGKNNILQTPFQAQSSKAERVFKDGGDTQLKGGFRAPSRPLLDKTPFPNRIITTTEYQTPFAQGLGGVDTPDSVLRPSSARKHIRVPRSSQKFETPLNTRSHWDISDDNIEVALPEPPKVVEQEDDYDDVEYMPPNTLDLPYQPPIDFEIPDFKELGKALVEASRNGLFHEEGPPPPELEFDVKDLEPCSWNLPSLPPLDDDNPFKEAKQSTSTQKTKAVPVPVPHVRARSVASGSRALSRPGTSASTVVPSRTVSSRAGVVPSTSTVARTTVKPSVTRGTIPITTTTTTKMRPAVSRSKSATASTISKASAVSKVTAAATTVPRTKPSQSSSKVAAAAAVKRPATSASTYRPALGTQSAKPSALSTRRLGVGSAKTNALVPHGRRIVQASEEDELAKVLKVAGPVEVEDFMFDV